MFASYSATSVITPETAVKPQRLHVLGAETIRCSDERATRSFIVITGFHEMEEFMLAYLHTIM